MILNFQTDDEADNWAISRLRARGFAVVLVDRAEWIRPADLCRRLRMNPATFLKRLHHAACPPYASRTSPTGRLLMLAINEDLLAWLKAPLTPGKPARIASRSVAGGARPLALMPA